MGSARELSPVKPKRTGAFESPAATTAGSSSVSTTKKRGRPSGTSTKNKEPPISTKRPDAAKSVRQHSASLCVSTAKLNRTCSDRGEEASSAFAVTIIVSQVGPVKHSGEDKAGANKPGFFPTTVDVHGPRNVGQVRNALKLAAAVVVDSTEGENSSGTKKKLPPKHSGSLHCTSSVLSAKAHAEAIKNNNQQSSAACTAKAAASCRVVPADGNRITAAQLSNIGSSTMNSAQKKRRT